jgi:energy-coupling factor transport system ATP-binding protein
VAFGAESGFLVGAITMLVSNVLFGQGPWTPWQMFAMGVLGLLAGILFQKGLLSRDRLSLSIFGGLSIFVIYGGILNPTSVWMYQSRPTLKMILATFVTGLPADAVHAMATVFFLWFLSESMLEKLDRVKVKYGLIE